MAAQWVSLGDMRWYYYPDEFGPLEGGWTTIRRDRAQTLWRFGDPAQLELLRGKIVRGYRILGNLHGNLRQTISVAGWPYYVVPQPLFVVPGYYEGDGNFSTNYADTTIPIGRFPDNDAFSDVQGDSWGGLFSDNWVVATDPEDPPFIRFASPGFPFEISVLVDDQPTWTVDYAAAVTRTQSIPFIVTVQYPSGEKIAGLEITLLGGAKTSVRGQEESSYTALAKARTNSAGVATFDVRGDFNGPDQLGIYITNTRIVALFDPPLNTYLPIAVNGLPSDDPTQECYQVPAVPGSPAIPARIDIIPTFAWDSGANSTDMLAGDASLRFTMNKVVGVVLGFMDDPEDREDVLAYARMSHAFFFNQTPAGAMRVQVMESGVLKGQKIAYSNVTEFEIRRVGEAVTYRIDGELFYASRAPNDSDPLSVGVALYGTGDQVT